MSSNLCVSLFLAVEKKKTKRVEDKKLFQYTYILKEYNMTFLASSLRVLKNLKDVPYDRFLGLVSYKISDDDVDYLHIKKRKTRFELCLLSACVCGIEFCYAAETAFVSPTLLQIGVPVVYMTLVWCLSPILGFLLVPLFGSISDRCRSRLGRRRPFILILSCGIIVGLILVPEGKSIGRLLGDVYEVHKPTQDETYKLLSTLPTGSNSLNGSTILRNEATFETDLLETVDGADSYMTTTLSMVVTATSKIIRRGIPHSWSILFTVLGVIMLDFSCDACQSPCRAYMLDVTTPEDHAVGLSTFTVLAGLGGSLGYVFGGIHWGSTELGASLGSQVRIVFSIVLVIYIFCLALTVTSIKEIPIDKLGISEEHLQRKRKKKDGAKYRKFTNEEDSLDDVDTEGHTMNYGSQLETSLTLCETEKVDPRVPNGYQQPDNQQVMATEQASVPPPEADTDQCTKPVDQRVQEPKRETLPEHEGIALPAEVSLKTYLRSILHMPRSLAVLCLTNLFCWMSLVCYSLYFTDFVGQAIYKGDPAAPEGSPAHAIYEEGVRMGSFGMALYSISCSLYSLSIEKLVKTFGEFFRRFFF